MTTGERFIEGYKAIEAGRIEGTYSLMEAIAELYLYDEIDDIIYGNLINYVAAMDVKKAGEADQWLKLFLLDARYGRLILQPGDLLENIKSKLDETERVHDEYIIQRMLDGSIGKIKYAEGAYYTIQFDYEKNIQYLVRIADNNMTPMDFDVEDFRMNRLAKRIEFVYTRGNRKVMSMNLDGSDKRELDRTVLYPENEK